MANRKAVVFYGGIPEAAGKIDEILKEYANWEIISVTQNVTQDKLFIITIIFEESELI